MTQPYQICETPVIVLISTVESGGKQAIKAQCPLLMCLDHSYHRYLVLFVYKTISFNCQKSWKRETSLFRYSHRYLQCFSEDNGVVLSLDKNIIFIAANTMVCDACPSFKNHRLRA
jgi:hypothetical protein